MFDAIVLAGGKASRLGALDKPGIELDGVALLDRVLAALGSAVTIIVVGPARPVSRVVSWCREQPAGGGPVAALAAGVELARSEVILTLAADLPWIAPAVPPLLNALAGTDYDCAALTDGVGRVNYLAAAWSRTSLLRALASIGDPGGASMRSLLGAARVLEVPDAGGWGLDCDTPGDVAEARRRLEPRRDLGGNALA